MQYRKNVSKARIVHNYIRDGPGWDEEYHPTIDNFGTVFTFVAETGARRTEVEST
jgi:hypothetical protein